MRYLTINGIARTLQRLARPVFRIIAVFALIYFVNAIVAQWPSISSWRPTLTELCVVLGLMLFYGASQFLLAENWHRLINTVGAAPVPRNATYPSFTSTQIAKYLPGNVFHFVGRHVWLTQMGIAQESLILASGFEIAGLVAGATAMVSIAAFYAPLPVGGPVATVVNSLAPVGVSVSTLFMVGCLFIILQGGLNGKVVRYTRGLASVLALYTLFFFGQGLFFYVLCITLDPSAGLFVIAAAGVSWIAGFLTPGAPSGLGPREVVLLLLLRPGMSEEYALIAIASFRLVTTLGDMVCYSLGKLIFRAGLPKRKADLSSTM